MPQCLPALPLHSRGIHKIYTYMCICMYIYVSLCVFTYMCIYFFAKLPRKKTPIPFASKQPGVEIPPPSFEHAHRSSSACLGSVGESRTNSCLTAHPWTRCFLAGSDEGCSMLALGSGTSPQTQRKEEGLQANVLFAFPFILPLPMSQNGCGEHPLARMSCQGQGTLVVPIQQGCAEVWP